uniref:Uncharacterized protein n=1 Tax=Branchiostoma floridae TaxID=7739 RepID=C3ZQL3_BRAFL|eukprot:XP_002589258.1 hypothetical protein BRAFLDRAFT_74583 [Branchiostoma floridae]
MADPQPAGTGGGKVKRKAFKSKKQRYSALARLSNKAQGMGRGSRTRIFDPPVGYEVQTYEQSHVMYTPGKTRIRSAAASADILQERGFNRSFILESSESEAEQTSLPADGPLPEDQPSTSADRPLPADQPSTSADRPLPEDQPSTSADRPLPADQPSTSADRPLPEDQPSTSADRPLPEDQPSTSSCMPRLREPYGKSQ